MDATVFSSEVQKMEKEIIEMRRYFHAHPELSYLEKETSSYIASKLREYKIDVKTGVGGYGVVGLIKASGAKETIGLRADMDALPVKEETGLPFASKNDGVMHACGHDNHIAMLLGAASIISKHKEILKKNIKFLFQPAEEDGGRGGALPMIEAGALENPKVDHVYGLHIMTNFPSGTIAIRSGPIMAAPDMFKIDVEGKGGHGSEPQHTVDPIFIGTQVINTLYGIRSRYVQQTKPLVISVCMVSSGTKDNIIPDSLHMEGTIRNLDEKVREDVKLKIKEIVPPLAKAYGAISNIYFKEDTYPVTYNDPNETTRVTEALKLIKGAKIIGTEPLMGAEDVSRFLEKAPGTYFFLGTRNDKKGTVYPNHSSKFTSDEEVLKIGTLAHVLISFMD